MLCLRASGKAENALIIFCNFWKVPAVRDLQNSEMRIQNKVGRKWASERWPGSSIIRGVYVQGPLSKAMGSFIFIAPRMLGINGA